MASSVDKQYRAELSSTFVDEQFGPLEFRGAQDDWE
jgi:hypothetical protein